MVLWKAPKIFKTVWNLVKTRDQDQDVYIPLFGMVWSFLQFWSHHLNISKSFEQWAIHSYKLNTVAQGHAFKNSIQKGFIASYKYNDGLGLTKAVGCVAPTLEAAQAWAPFSCHKSILCLQAASLKPHKEVFAGLCMCARGHLGILELAIWASH